MQTKCLSSRQLIPLVREFIPETPEVVAQRQVTALSYLVQVKETKPKSLEQHLIRSPSLLRMEIQ